MTIMINFKNTYHILHSLSAYADPMYDRHHLYEEFK